MARAANFSREDLAAMEAACPTAAVKDIARRGGVQGPSMGGASGQLYRTSTSPGIAGSNTTGWARATPLGPPSGVVYADKLMDVQDERDTAERIRQEVVVQAVRDAVKP